MAVDAPRLVFLVLILLFIFVSPDTRYSAPSQRQELSDHVTAEKYALRVLNQSTFGDFNPANGRWLNITGLRATDGYAWDLLPRVQEAARDHFRVAVEGSPSLQAHLVTNNSHDEAILNDEGKTLPQKILEALSLTESATSVPFYQNVTGMVKGQWYRSMIRENSTLNELNVSVIAPGYLYSSSSYKRNITGLSGELRIKLDEKKSQDSSSKDDQKLVREIKAEVLIDDESYSGDGWNIVMFGVHYPKQGRILLSTTSERLAGIFALPHFGLSNREFARTQRLLNQSLQETINSQEADFDIDVNPWSSSPNNPSDVLFPPLQCEYICYLQQYPLEPEDLDIGKLEEELQHPTGAPLKQAPAMKMSALLFSPDCGFVLESKGPPQFSPSEGTHLNGPKLEPFLGLAKESIFFYALVIAAQVLLLKRQIQEASTPSTRSRVSYYTVAMMALGDGFTSLCLLAAGLFIDALFLPLISTAFLSVISTSFFGMKFIMDVYTVQAPEREEREREQRREAERQNANANANATNASTDTTSGTATTTAAGEDGLPLPATARRRAENTLPTPFALASDQDTAAGQTGDDNNPAGNQPMATPTTTIGSARRELGALYSRFYFLLFTLSLLCLHATTWPLTLRSAFCNLLAFIYFSFWTPQIYRNVMRNCRKALRWEFVIGESLCRLFPFVYLYTVQDNILWMQTDPFALFVLAGWVWIQAWALATQEILGPRFFVPNGWAPPAYDYHPILREGDGSDGESGALLPLGFTESLNSSNNHPAGSVTSPTSPSSVTGSGGTQPSTTSTVAAKRKDGKRTFDCAICTEDIEVPVVGDTTATEPSSTTATAATALSTTLFSRRAYMVTPCRHIFHSTCLEGWMRYRLQCPICRESLPPL